MGKITIHKHHYFRPKRHFKHQQETTEEQKTAEPLQEENSAAEEAVSHQEAVTVERTEAPAKAEVAAPVRNEATTRIEEPIVTEEVVTNEPVVNQIPIVEHQPAVTVTEPVRHKKSDSRFNWLYLIPAMLFGVALMMLWNLFTDQPEPAKPIKPAVVDTLSKTEQAIKKTRSDVVSVVNLHKANNLLNESEVPAEVGIGSGVIYKLTDKDAFIVTNYHVIKGAEELQVTLADNRKVAGQIVGSDEWTDLAVIKIPRGNVKDVIRFANSDDIVVGETAIAIGSPLSQTFAGSVSQGIISGLNRSVPVDLDGDGAYDWESNVIQTDAAINPGNSGGALVNDNGQLIGINAMKISLDNVEGINFAIPSNDVKKITAILETKHKVVRPEMGVQVQDINNLQLDAIKQQLNLPADMSKGIIVMAVETGSAVAQAGLQPEDIITQMDGVTLDGIVQFRKQLYYDHQKGDQLDLTVYSKGSTKHIKVTLK